jgi:CYTH domain-containing protein
MADESLHISQAYLLRSKGLTVRIRKQKDHKDKIKYYFTTKQKVEDKIIEIEKKIQQPDFEDLAKVAVGWVHKIRYVVKNWEVDFFKENKKTYFIMAEIEMPHGMEEPKEVPGFVTENLLFKVPREDCRFSSKKLSDVDYAKTLLDEVMEKEKAANGDKVGRLKF